MVHWRNGRVVSVIRIDRDVSRCQVQMNDGLRTAMAYVRLTGPVNEGDEVIVNASAIDLGLGTGGLDFVAWNLTSGAPRQELHGHIMKLRYTPWQICCGAAEADDGTLHRQLAGASSIDGMPVIVCGLHSQIAPIAAALADIVPDPRTAYIMTDAGALPAWFSCLSRDLRQRGLLSTIITCGHAFGGDIETVNVFSGLLAAHATGHTVAITAPGPGHAGTGTRFGFSGIEQGQIIDAVNTLGGVAVGVLRISFSDPRPRHLGVSHHSLTALGLVAQTSAHVAVPILRRERLAHITRQLDIAPGMKRHRRWLVDGAPALAALRERGIDVTTMGRDVANDEDFFLAAGAAAVVAGRQIQSG